MDRARAPSRLSERRSAKSLAPIETSFRASGTGVDSNPAPTIGYGAGRNAPTSPLTPPTPSLRSRSSKLSLFSLFSRPTYEKQRGYHNGPSFSTQLPTPSTSPPSSLAAPKSHQKLSPASPKVKQRSEALRRSDSMTAAWTPPPLFQAYPQAIKHITLEAPASSATSIMRARQHTRQYSLIQEMMESKLDLADTRGSGNKSRKQRAIGSPHQRRTSVASATGIDFTRKTYMLVTSGYLLQYTGYGPSDRIPEKSLQLGRDSAAFACDLIEGKHYVLQICQRVDGDGKITHSRSILSKFRFPSSSARKTTSSILMIFESAEEMDLWMVAIRKQIEALGGKQHRPSSSIAKVKDTAGVVTPGDEQPSHRYQIRRDPYQFSSPTSPIMTTSRSQTMTTLRSHTMLSSDSDVASFQILDPTPNANPRHSSRLPSLTEAANPLSAQHDARRVSGLGRDAFRFSYISNASRTSGGSSPGASAANELPQERHGLPQSSSQVMPAQAPATRRMSSQDVINPGQQAFRTAEPYQRRLRLSSSLSPEATTSVDISPTPLVPPTVDRHPPAVFKPVRKFATSPSGRYIPSIPPTIIDEILASDPPTPDTAYQPAQSLQLPQSFRPTPGVGFRPGHRPFPLPIRISSYQASPSSASPTRTITASASPQSHALQPQIGAPAIPRRSFRRPTSVQIGSNHTAFLSSMTSTHGVRSSIDDHPSKVPSPPAVASMQAARAAKYAMQLQYSQFHAVALPPLSAPPPDIPLPPTPMYVGPTPMTA